MIFTPHLVPMDRGILSTSYASRPATTSTEALLSLSASSTPTSRSSAWSSRLPATKDVSGTNFCDITARVVRGRVVVVQRLDNLIKGASGAAVQNFNLMYGIPETTALL